MKLIFFTQKNLQLVMFCHLAVLKYRFTSTVKPTKLYPLYIIVSFFCNVFHNIKRVFYLLK